MNVKRNLTLSALPIAFVLGGLVTTATGHGFYTVQLSNTSEPVAEVTTTTEAPATTTTVAPVAAEPVAEAPVVTEAPKPVVTTEAPKPSADALTGHKVPAKKNVAPGEPSCPSGYGLSPSGCEKVAVPTTRAPEAPKAAPKPQEATVSPATESAAS